MSFVFVPPAPRSPIVDLDPHELAAVVSGTISVPAIASMASKFILLFRISGSEFMCLGEAVLHTLSNNDPVALEQLKTLRTSPPEFLQSLLSFNTRSPSLPNSFRNLASSSRKMQTNTTLSQEVTGDGLDVEIPVENPEPDDFDEEDSTADHSIQTNFEAVSCDFLQTNLVTTDAINPCYVSPSSSSSALLSDEQNPASADNVLAEEQDSSAMAVSPSRNVVIRVERPPIMTPPESPSGYPLPNASGAASFHTISHNIPTEHHFMFLLLLLYSSFSRNNPKRRRLYGADVQNNAQVLATFNINERRHFRLRWRFFPQPLLSVKDAIDLDFDRVLEPRHVIDVNTLDSDQRFNKDNFADDSVEVQESSLAKLPAEEIRLSLPIIPLDRSFSQEVCSSLESLSLDFSEHATPIPEPLVLRNSFLPKPFPATPHMSLPSSECVGIGGQSSVPSHIEEELTRQPKVEEPSFTTLSKPRRHSPNYINAAVQADLDFPKQLLHVKTSELSQHNPSGLSPLSAILPTRSSLLGNLQKAVANVLPQEVSDLQYLFSSTPIKTSG